MYQPKENSSCYFYALHVVITASFTNTRLGDVYSLIKHVTLQQ